MRKIFLSFLIFILASSSLFADELDSDAENHKIIGGLYSLAAAVELHAKTNPDVNSLVRFFERIPAGWQNEVKIETDKNKKSIWVGISVAKSSNARRYLRSNAKKLRILESPGGETWLSGEFAWLKAADVVKKKLQPIEFSAAESDGIIFFNANSESWFAAWPNFNSSSIRKILEEHGPENHTELVAPKNQDSKRVSIYDEVRPSSVRVPDEMHVGTKKSSFDMSMEVGDVIINPIPNVHRQ